MECPNGCGDMVQLVSITRVADEKPGKMVQKFVELIFEQCAECGYEESIDVAVVEDDTHKLTGGM